MLKQERLLKMEKYISENRFVSTAELCKVFSISINTARSDVKTLVKKGNVQKTYGGICITNTAHYTPFDLRKNLNSEIKQKIAKAAAALIEDGDIIFIDSGTTTMSILDYLSPEKKITVVTNSLSICNQATANSNIQLICIGGTYQNKTNSFLVFKAINDIHDYNINKAFMGAAGVSSSGNLTNSVSLECEIRKTVVQCCEKSYLLADSAKIGKAALLTYAVISQMDTFITDNGIPDYFKKLCNDCGTKMIIVDADD